MSGNKMTSEDLKKILAELNTWCVNYQGNINRLFSNCMTLEDKVTKLFWVVKQILQNDINITEGWEDLYKFVMDYFDNLDLQEEVDTALKNMAQDGTLASYFDSFWRIIHVRDFGAKGDGVTDDTEAIQKALNFDTNGLLKVVLIDPGQYHTTESLIVPENTYVCCTQYGDAFFIDNFNTGTFTLSNNNWFENIGFLTSQAGCALYGNNVSSINIYRVQCSGQTIGSESFGSQFLKLVGTPRVIMVDDCLIDSGGSNFAVEIRNENEQSNNDIVFRNCFIDNFKGTEQSNLGGSVYLNNVKLAVFNNCIIRSNVNTFFADNNSDCRLDDCYVSRSNTGGYALIIGNQSIVNFNSILDYNSYIENNGVLGFIDEYSVYKTILSKNYLQSTFTINELGNGRYYVIGDNTQFNVVSKTFNTQAKNVFIDLNYFGIIVENTRYGLGWQSGTTQHVIAYQPSSHTIVVQEYNNGAYVKDVFSPFIVDGKYTFNIFYEEYQGAIRVHYRYGSKSFYSEIGTEIIQTYPEKTIFFGNNENSNYDMVVESFTEL